jgi:hypothetical protein
MLATLCPVHDCRVLPKFCVAARCSTLPLYCLLSAANRSAGEEAKLTILGATSGDTGIVYTYTYKQCIQSLKYSSVSWSNIA